jgi:hypothetical protein
MLTLGLSDTLLANLPSKSVYVPNVVPFNGTLTPGIGIPDSSKTTVM